MVGTTENRTMNVQLMRYCDLQTHICAHRRILGNGVMNCSRDYEEGDKSNSPLPLTLSHSILHIIAL